MSPAPRRRHLCTGTDLRGPAPDSSYRRIQASCHSVPAAWKAFPVAGHVLRCAVSQCPPASMAPVWFVGYLAEPQRLDFPKREHAAEQIFALQVPQLRHRIKGAQPLPARRNWDMLVSRATGNSDGPDCHVVVCDQLHVSANRPLPNNALCHAAFAPFSRIPPAIWFRRASKSDLLNSR